ncbi:hypothetical protein HHI36_019338 [Cryptolaemus montrouzieri]|uniref:Uncharacterized protein n=2 Tax=Cryptolaemus montrouzieri TaxID=559131 RepID=A0ABD2P364_9CUCU
MCDGELMMINTSLLRTNGPFKPSTAPEATRIRDKPASSCSMLVKEVLRSHFDGSFPLKTKKRSSSDYHNNKWITTGIRLSSARLKSLYLLSVNADYEQKNYYKKYKGVYRKVVDAAKRMYNDSLMRNSENPSKMAWSIIKGSRKEKKAVSLSIDDVESTDPVALSDHFSKFLVQLVNYWSQKRMVGSNQK